MKLLLLAIGSLLAGNAYSQIYGCTDPASVNYNAFATVNDGSCNYPASAIAPTSTTALPLLLAETSGLLHWNNTLLTHNDNADSNLYAIDSGTGSLVTQYLIPGGNQDWEEISQDQDYIYIGDFGNNVNGSRTNLKILRVSKAGLSTGQQAVETIAFTYQDQTQSTPFAANTTDFDCEAFIVSTNFIYLFTKQWTTKATTVYKLPKIPGQHVAVPMQTYNVQGLITAATFVESANMVTLAGYDEVLNPFLLVLYDFNDDNFFSGNKRKLNLSLPFHQIEGISSVDGVNYHLTNERFVQAPYLNIAPKLHTVDLTDIVGPFFSSLTTDDQHEPLFEAYGLNDLIHIRTAPVMHGSEFNLYDGVGRLVMRGTLDAEYVTVNGEALADGLYYLSFNVNQPIIKVVLR